MVANMNSSKIKHFNYNSARGKRVEIKFIYLYRLYLNKTIRVFVKKNLRNNHEHTMNFLNLASFPFSEVK